MKHVEIYALIVDKVSQFDMLLFPVHYHVKCTKVVASVRDC